ncbi:MAG: decaprenyl-phosphate phosphoribosyltransferase [Williamsia sp.]|nr:decaprenyl-phosphate phosphoribosyltransferase [Williamsia sp.]
MDIIKLLRPKDWAKNAFLFLPIFFAGDLFNLHKLLLLLLGFVAFSFTASTIYILNDYRDREDDRKHPVKSKRPLAAGKVKPGVALAIAAVLLVTAFSLAIAGVGNSRFTLILAVYFSLNLGYSLGLKNISVLDILIIAAGFVLRLKGGGYIADVEVSPWLTLMVLLLSLFMAIAKRRDDILLKLETGTDMRRSVKGYNLDFLNTLLSLFSAVIIVTYIMYTLSPRTYERLQSYHLYYTSIFVIAGLMRYLQISLVQNKAGSPTELLYKDIFLQTTIVLWMASFYIILYFKKFTLLSGWLS